MPDLCTCPASVLAFGAVGDGVADDTAAIQAAIDASMYGHHRPVMLPAGLYRITDTLHLGYGDQFKSIVFEGDGYKYRGSAHCAGTAILADFSDRPAMNVQGARGSRLRGFAVLGPLADYIDAHNMGANTAPLIDDTDPDHWHDPSLAATQDSQYAPCAAITIDAYAGPRPSTSYPDVTYPAWLDTPQYGKKFSSDVLIEDVFLRGFTVGIANQPCDADGNGDFLALLRVYIERCKWGVSVGNSQSRNVHIDGMKANRVYAVLTNRRHGQQHGKFGGAITDLSVFGAINVFDFGGFFSQPITFINLYAESLWRIGTLEASSTNENTVNFISPELNFTGQIPERGIPATVLDGGSQGIHVKFHGGLVHGYPSVVVMTLRGVAFDGCYFRHSERAARYEQCAHNFLAGGLVTQNFWLPTESHLKSRFFNLDTGDFEPSVAFTRAWTTGSRRHGIPLYAEQVGAEYERWDRQPNPLPYFVGQFAKSSLAAAALNGRTLTMQFTARTEQKFAYNGPLPGDVLYDDGTASVFFVRARTGLSVTAELQNNYKADGAGGYTTITIISLTSGNFYVGNARVYTPPYYLRGDLTAGSATIANCGRDDGFATWYDAEIAVGDWVAVRDTQDRFVGPTASMITGRDQSVGTLTLGSTTGVRTATRQRLPFFFRQPPENS